MIIFHSNYYTHLQGDINGILDLQFWETSRDKEKKPSITSCFQGQQGSSSLMWGEAVVFLQALNMESKEAWETVISELNTI